MTTDSNSGALTDVDRKTAYKSCKKRVSVVVFLLN